MRSAVALALAALGGAPFAAAQTAGPPARPPAAAVAASAPAVSRDGIEALELQLDRAVDQVSQPRPVALPGRDNTRGYRLPGYGLVLVLTPRTLPGSGGFTLARPSHRIEMRRVRPHAAEAPQAPGAQPAEAPDEVGALERQVIVLQQETEQTRRAAEQDMERIVQDLRVRLATPDELHVEVTTNAAPQAAPVAPTPPAQPQTPLPAEAPLPAPPPWKFWFGTTGPHDPRSQDALVADVRRALVDALASGPGRLPGLSPEEFVTVAVDFERAGLFLQRLRPEKTLVLRARVRDLEAHARGRLGSDELRHRIEVLEY